MGRRYMIGGGFRHYGGGVMSLAPPLTRSTVTLPAAAAHNIIRDEPWWGEEPDRRGGSSRWTSLVVELQTFRWATEQRNLQVRRCW